MLNANETVERCALPFYTFLRSAAPATERRKAFRGLCVSSVSHTRARSPARSLNESSQMVGRERDETKVIITMIIISENRVYESSYCGRCCCWLLPPMPLLPSGVCLISAHKWITSSVQCSTATATNHLQTTWNVKRLAHLWICFVRSVSIRTSDDARSHQYEVVCARHAKNYYHFVNMMIIISWSSKERRKNKVEIGNCALSLIPIHTHWHTRAVGNGDWEREQEKHVRVSFPIPTINLVEPRAKRLKQKMANTVSCLPIIEVSSVVYTCHATTRLHTHRIHETTESIEFLCSTFAVV